MESIQGFTKYPLLQVYKISEQLDRLTRKIVLVLVFMRKHPTTNRVNTMRMLCRTVLLLAKIQRPALFLVKTHERVRYLLKRRQ